MSIERFSRPRKGIYGEMSNPGSSPITLVYLILRVDPVIFLSPSIAMFIFISSTILTSHLFYKHTERLCLHIAPLPVKIMRIVLRSILRSSPTLQLVIYSVSSLTTSSKSVILLLPLTCHKPVIPGFIAILARW